MSRYHLSMSIVVIACFIAAGVFRSCQSPAIEFADLEDAKKQMEDRGYHCVMLQKGNFEQLIASKNKLSNDEIAQYISNINGISRIKGKVLMRKAVANSYHNEPNYFVGKVEVIGDEAIINELLQR